MSSVIMQDAEELAKRDLPWEKLEHKTLFVTGATGFIGSAVVRAIMSRNKLFGSDIKVAAMVRSVEKGQQMFAEYLENGQLEFVKGNVCDAVEYNGKADYIIHCASNAAPKEYAEDPVGTMKTNFDGTFNLLELAKKLNVKKFLYVSTIEVYGTTDIGENEEISEDGFGYINATNTRSCYTISKKACETMSVCYAKQFGIPVSIGRLSYIFGAGMKKNDSKIVAILARDAAKGENLVLKSKGEQLRSYTYVSDAVAGLLTVLVNGTDGEAYNIASQKCKTTIAGIGYALEKLYADKGIKVMFDISPEEAKSFSPIRNAVLSNKKITEIGWKSEIDLNTGLKKMVTSISE